LRDERTEDVRGMRRIGDSGEEIVIRNGDTGGTTRTSKELVHTLVTEIFTFYFILLITPKPSPGLLGFDLACVLAYADLRLPTFHTPQLCYIVAASFQSPSVLSSHCWTSGMCSL
jgi:hypothetical protein